MLQEGSNSKRIDVIFDVNKENSIKNVEREKRRAEFGNEFRNIHSEHKVQQWRKFRLNPKNKKAFTEFVVKEWSRDKYRTNLTGKVLFVTCESDCYEITSQAANIVDEFNSTQEEADTRLILHAGHAARSGYKAVVVASEDTDVFLLCLECLSALFRHPCMSSVERRQELDMSVSPARWQPREENFANA